MLPIKFVWNMMETYFNSKRANLTAVLYLYTKLPTLTLPNSATKVSKHIRPASHSWFQIPIISENNTNSTRTTISTYLLHRADFYTKNIIQTKPKIQFSYSGSKISQKPNRTHYSYLSIGPFPASNAANEALSGQCPVAHDNEPSLRNSTQTLPFESQRLTHQFQSLASLREIWVGLGLVFGLGPLWIFGGRRR